MDQDSLLAELSVAAERDGVQRFVVGAVVCKESKVLLLQRPENDFMGGILELPSGKVEAGETLDAALVREVKEETGLDVSRIGDYLGSFDYTSGSGKKSRQFNFLVDTADAETLELNEHDSYTWISPTDEPPVTEAIREVLHGYWKSR